jgi:hypothetical protein
MSGLPRLVSRDNSPSQIEQPKQRLPQLDSLEAPNLPWKTAMIAMAA